MRPLSARNPRIGRLAKLAAKRAERDRERAFVVEGPTLLRAVVDAGATVQEVYVDEGALDRPAVLDALDALDADVVVWSVPAGVLDRVGDAETSQGVTAIVARRSATAPTPDRHPFVLVLVGLQIPGNVGTLVRAAAAAGAGAVVCVGGADPFGPKAVRASAGAVASIEVDRVGEGAEALDALSQAGYRLAAAVVRDGASHVEADLREPLAVVLGSEAHGLPAALADRADVRVTIDMAGPTESLNVAMAGTVLAFEVLRQRTAT